MPTQSRNQWTEFSGRLLGLESELKKIAPVTRVDKFWPHSQDYFNPLNSVLLSESFETCNFDRKAEWFVRDSESLLQDYFKKYPKPPSARATWYFERSVHRFIPPAWKKRAKLYEVLKLKQRPIYRNRVIVEKESASMQRDFARARDRVKKLLSATELGEIRKWSWVDLSNTVVSPQAGLSQSRRKLLSAADLLYIEPIGRSHFLPADGKRHIADSFITHFFLGNGGNVLGVRETRESELSFQLSPFHGLKVF